VDSERAERHLRLAAEAELRHALSLPRYDAEVRARDVFIDCIARVHGVAATLIAAGAIDAHRAELITLQFQTALAVRHRLHPHAAGPLLGPPHRWWPGPAQPAAPGTPGAQPARVIPVGRMLPFRGEDMAGELYVLSLVITAHQAVAPVVARIRPAVHGGGWFPAAHGYVPASLTATDDQGTAYIARLDGGGDRNQWEGRVQFHPAPPPSATWLRLGAGHDDTGFRIDLTGKPAATDGVVTPVSAGTGEWLLDNMVRDIAARAVEGSVSVQRRGGPGDVITALEAAGALSPFSPTPGRIAMIYERIGIKQHGITGRPAADLPEPWLGVLAYFGRRHRPPVQDGTATVAVVLPEMDGAQLVLVGLHTRADQTFLHIVARGLPDMAGPGNGQAALLDSGGWLRDDAGQWHVAVQREWRGAGHDEASVVWRVLPPLGRETAAFTLVVTTSKNRATVHVPLSWWASP
jgi:hypothetical protein